MRNRCGGREQVFEEPGDVNSAPEVNLRPFTAGCRVVMTSMRIRQDSIYRGAPGAPGGSS